LYITTRRSLKFGSNQTDPTPPYNSSDFFDALPGTFPSSRYFLVFFANEIPCSPYILAFCCLNRIFLTLYRLINDELHSLYSSPNIVRVIKSRRMRWAGHVARVGEGRGVYRVLVGRPEGKTPLGRRRRRWEDNIKMDLREIGIYGAN
jgi:hypothetical protein